MYLTELHNKALNQLLAKIGSNQVPVQIIIAPTAEAEPKNCFNNVARQVKKSGGEVVYGWAIGVSRFLVEAEKHAVWKKPDGILLDITPRVPEMSSLYFVETPDFVYTGQYIDNIRINGTLNSVVDDWIRISEAIEILFSYGKRLGEHEVSMPSDLIPFLSHLQQIQQQYEAFLNAGGSERATCFCGRPNIYKNCHGADMPNLEASLEKVKLFFGSDAN